MSDRPPPPAPPTTGDVNAEDLSEFEEEFDDVDTAGIEDLGDEPEGPAPRIVALDIGEVLIDETRVWSIWAELCGVSPLTFAAVLGAAIAQGADHREVFDHVAPNIAWRDFVDEHERRYGGFTSADLYADAAPCLRELSDLGFDLVLAGNQPIERGEQLASLGLAHDVVTTSAQLGVDKPDPEFFTSLLRLVDAPEPADVLYVGDRVDNDMLPAASLGMRTCWLRRGPWGQLQDLPEGVEVDLVLDGLGELALLLSQWRDADAT